MDARKLIEILTVTERLKDTLRHCYTTQGRRESVAEHSWMMSLMAMLIADEFPEANIEKIIKMCLLHDLGECFTGDIPAFEKTDENIQTENNLLVEWLKTFSSPYADEWQALFVEMNALQTLEAKIYKALDGLEALIQHNISDIATWEDREIQFNLNYADDKVAFSDYFTTLREEIRKDSLEKLREH